MLSLSNFVGLRRTNHFNFTQNDGRYNTKCPLNITFIFFYLYVNPKSNKTPITMTVFIFNCRSHFYCVNERVRERESQCSLDLNDQCNENICSFLSVYSKKITDRSQNHYAFISTQTIEQLIDIPAAVFAIQNKVHAIINNISSKVSTYIHSERHTCSGNQHIQ